MAVVGMIGPHAIGKTTATNRWKAKYGDLLDVYPLDQIRSAARDNKAKQELVQQCQSARKVCLIESARGFAAWLSVLRPSDPLIVLTCSEPRAREWLTRRRMEKLGKPLNSAFWTERRLKYECEGYMLNWAARVPGSRHFVIDDRARDWAAVDDYFGTLFRRLHNAIIRDAAIASSSLNRPSRRG